MSTLRLPPIIVGPLLQEKRKAANLSQIELAEKIGVTSRSVQAWEAGQVPQPRHRRALSEFFAPADEAAA